MSRLSARENFMDHTLYTVPYAPTLSLHTILAKLSCHKIICSCHQIKAFGNECCWIASDIIIMKFYKILALFHSINNIHVCMRPLWRFWLLNTMRQNTTGYILYHVHTWVNYTCTGTFSCTSSLIIDKGLQQELSVACDCRTAMVDSI